MHWLETENSDGMPTWSLYVECSHWGMFFVSERLRINLPLGIPMFRDSIYNTVST